LKLNFVLNILKTFVAVGLAMRLPHQFSSILEISKRGGADF
jgi:hypothetical protein